MAGEDQEPEERELSPEARARREAALRVIRQYGDPVLRSRALTVDRFDGHLREQVEQMGRLMDDAIGIGLAATQVGLLNRVLVYRVEPDGPLNALVNPEIEWTGEETEWGDEGCLSLPGLGYATKRYESVTARGFDQHGEPLVIECTGFLARALQHEVDHLDGRLYVDTLTGDVRRQALREMRRVVPR